MVQDSSHYPYSWFQLIGHHEKCFQ
jgi:hypothetical protein